VIAGSTNELVAGRIHHRYGHRWKFTRWLDGRPRVHEVSPRQDHRYVAVYERRGR
jgi:hypothetical protein